MGLTVALIAVAGGVLAGVVVYVGVVTGALTIDLRVGRRTRQLGPVEVDIDAPRDKVFAAAMAPYALRPTRAMKEKVTVLERGDGMVLAAHRTPTGFGLVATTTETVAFDPPERIGFRLLRGPVPEVSETFELIALSDDVTRLVYTGTMGADLWWIGDRWSDLVQRSWVGAVRRSLAKIKEQTEARA